VDHTGPVTGSLYLYFFLHIWLHLRSNASFLWRFDRIPCRGLPSLGFTITLMDTPRSVGLLRRVFNPTSQYTHTRQPSMPIGGTRTRKPSKWAAADPGLRPCGSWDRQTL